MRLSISHDSEGKFKTLDGGHTLRLPVQPADLSPVNKPVLLAIRPEHLRLTTEADGDNTLAAVVREINFAGATTTIKLDAGGLLLEALTFRPRDIAAGDACTVLLPAEHLAILGTSDKE
jgi:ABC-type Fe3+/spermidine/putrescine transport system ATPase subunit